MKKLAIIKLAKDFGSAVAKHSPEILVGLGISGMIATTVLAVRATPKALSLLEEKAHEERCSVRELTVGEKITTCWRCYIPAAITGITSAACIIGANSVNTRRNAALAAAYTLSDSALREYRDKVVETIGKEEEKVVRDKIAKDRIDRDPVGNKEVFIVENGNTLCYDSLSGRYFKSDRDTIKKAENELNYNLINDVTGYVSLNEMYDALGLAHTKIGDELGWRSDDGMIEIEFSSQIAENGQPCLVLDYNKAPKYDYASVY